MGRAICNAAPLQPLFATSHPLASHPPTPNSRLKPFLVQQRPPLIYLLPFLIDSFNKLTLATLCSFFLSSQILIVQPVQGGREGGGGGGVGRESSRVANGTHPPNSRASGQSDRPLGVLPSPLQGGPHPRQRGPSAPPTGCPGSPTPGPPAAAAASAKSRLQRRQ